MATIDVHIVGAFGDDMTDGSPTGVVLNADELSDAVCRQIVVSVGCSHVAFVGKPDASNGDVHVRFFTAAGEISNCAHATIAVHFLNHTMSSDGSDGLDRTVAQVTKRSSQDVTVSQVDGRTRVSFTQDPIEIREIGAGHVVALAGALGASPDDIDETQRVCLASSGSFRFLLPLKSFEHVRRLSPDFAALRRICRMHDSIGCFVYALDSPAEDVAQSGDEELRVSARMFAPGIAIEEDRVNGNSTGCLAAVFMSNRDVDLVSLRVSQGHQFGYPANVYARAVRSESGVRTIVGGGAKVLDKISVML